MFLDLERLLRQYCEEDGDLDLHKRLERVKVSARKIWAEPRLPWYTDHSFRHSRRVVNLLGQIVEHLQKTEKRLSPHELYILLVACYLHDIGMQALDIDGRGMETFDRDDYEFIRRRHPGRAYELIVERTVRRERGQFSIDLDDEYIYFIPIALVSQGHGSDFFEETLAEFAQKRYSLGGKRIRGDLLTALLLMADELDLQAERAQLRPEMDLSPISSMHHHVHLYVTSVEVTRGDFSKQRRIGLALEFPRDSTAYEKKIRKWLVSKLQRQCRITEPIIRRATDGELDWCEQIEIYKTFDRTGKAQRPLPPQALLQLEKQIVDRDTVNYDQVISILKHQVLELEEHCALCLFSQDERATAMAIKWLIAQCASQGILPLLFDLRHAVDTLKDIPIRLHKRLMAQGLSHGRSESQRRRDAQFNLSTSPANLYAMAAKDLRQFAARRRVVLVLQHVDRAESEAARWLEEDLLKRLKEEGPPIPVILTRGALPGPAEEITGNYQLLQLDNFSRENIATHYQRAFGFSEQEAQKRAQGAYAASKGRPADVIDWFECLREQESKLI